MVVDMTGFNLKRDAGAIKLKSAWVFPEKKTFSHRSDCAVHNGPAYPAGPCDCGVEKEPVATVTATVTSETGNPDVTMSWWHEPALPVGTKLYTTPPLPVQPTEDVTYAIALQRAIEIHCKGEIVPESVSVLCPHHAAKLNATLPAQPVQEPYDQTALELCNVCGWKTLIPDDGCLNCERAQPAQEPVAWTLLLTDEHHGIIGEAGEKFIGAPECYQRVNVYTAPPKRKWVGLTEEDFSTINQSCLTKLQAATSAESILRERNT